MASDFVSVAKLADMRENEVRQVSVGKTAVILCRVEGRVYALEDLCTHEYSALGRGRMIGHEVECPRHGARFDVRTGEATRLPAAAPIRTFPVRIEGGDVQVDVASGTEA
jgi:3-phenylpropionate/trans-cinnamate dioxygenase ferredoxin subunit